jgi:hypothetical protein
MIEFRDEARLWVKRLQTRPTHVEMLQEAITVSREGASMGQMVRDLLAAGREEEAQELIEEMRARQGAVADFKKVAPGLVEDIDKDGRQ